MQVVKIQKKRILPRCIHYIKKDFDNSNVHMRIPGTGPSSVILKMLKSDVRKFQMKLKPKGMVLCDKLIKLHFLSIIKEKHLYRYSKHYKSTAVDDKTLLHTPGDHVVREQ